MDCGQQEMIFQINCCASLKFLFRLFIVFFTCILLYSSLVFSCILHLYSLVFFTCILSYSSLVFSCILHLYSPITSRNLLFTQDFIFHQPYLTISTFWVIFSIAAIGLGLGTTIGVFILFAVQVSCNKLVMCVWLVIWNLDFKT